jgi:hypothetical protein
MTGLEGPYVEFVDNKEFKVADGTSLSPAGPADARRGPASLERPGVEGTMPDEPSRMHRQASTSPAACMKPSWSAQYADIVQMARRQHCSWAGNNLGLRQPRID